jgi:hypothetical protein
MVWDASNMRWWNVHYQLELNALRIFTVPKTKIWRTRVGRTGGVWGGGCTSKTVSGHALIWTFLLGLMWGSLSKHFRHILYSPTQVSLLCCHKMKKRSNASYGSEKRHVFSFRDLFNSDLRTFTIKRVMNIQNTPTVNFHRLAQRQRETSFYADATEIGSPSSFKLGSTGATPTRRTITSLC